MNVKSWYWLAVQIVPFCDLNRLPPIYCFATTTLCTLGRFWVLTVFWPIVADHISYLSDAGERITIAYSFPASKYTGDGNLTLVGTVASLDTLISLGLRATWVKSWTKNEVGVPNSTVLSSTNSFAFGSFVAKKRSNDVKNAPLPSTVNVCAKGSLWGALTWTLTSVFLAAGLGGFLTATLVVSWVTVVPEPLYSPIASEAKTVEFAVGVTPGGTAVTLTVLLPVLTLIGGAGVVFGSLKKKQATMSPQLSEINSDLVMSATAPLVLPTIRDPTGA